MYNLNRYDYDAVVIGSGPNGLSAAITIQQQGLSVLLIESKESIGGGMRSKELTLPGYIHDVCSAVHPMALVSPFFKKLPLTDYGLEYIFPPIAAAHPFDDGTAALVYKSISQTSETLADDADTYRRLLTKTVAIWPKIANDLLGPLAIPKYPTSFIKFGLNAIQSAQQFANRFQSRQARGLWAGMAAHAIQPLSNLSTSAIGLVLLTAAHTGGWPIVKGGSQNLANALSTYFLSIGGKIETDFEVKSLGQLPSAKSVIFDIGPKQLLKIAGHKFSRLYQWQLNKFRYGMGVFKVDWALKEPIPFIADGCKQAGTVHIGNTFEEIAQAEYLASKGKCSDNPFVLLAQQSLFDSRAPENCHTAWAYCHVPNGSEADMTNIIENQIERFAPGFRDIILEKHNVNAKQMEAYNPNYVGGDINGGILDIRQLFTRPALRLSPYKTSFNGFYICSSSTPPGGGVHGMNGYYAARRALKDTFKISIPHL